MISPVRPPSSSFSPGGDEGEDHQVVEEEVDFGTVMLDDPIVGVEAATSAQHTGVARRAKPLPTPKTYEPCRP